MKRERGLLRVFSRLSRLIYQLIAASFLGKLFTSYIAVNAALVGAGNAILSKKERVSLSRRHALRRSLACAMEQNLLSRAVRGVFAVLTRCNLRTYGFFFTISGAIFVSLYGASLFVSLGEIVTWVHLISGGICLAIGILLLFSDRSLGSALYRSPLMGALLFSLLGLPDESVKDMPQHGAQHYLMATVLALLLVALGLLVSPLAILQIVCSLLLVLLVLSVPESGFLLALFFLPFSRLLVGSYFLVFASLALMLISYFGKLLRGNRTFRVEWQDVPVILLMLMFAASLGTVSAAPVWRVVLIELLLSLSYLVAVNILSEQGWLASLRVTFVVSAALSALVGGVQLLLVITAAGDFTMALLPTLGQYVTGGFADNVVYAYYLALAFAFALPLTVYAQRRYRAAFVLMTALIVAAAVLTFVTPSWLSMLLMLLVFMLVYDYRSMPHIVLSSATVTGALLLLPAHIKERALSIFFDLVEPAYKANALEGSKVLNGIFFGSGEGFFSAQNGLLRFFFGSGHAALQTLHP